MLYKKKMSHTVVATPMGGFYFLERLYEFETLDMNIYANITKQIKKKKSINKCIHLLVNK